MLLGSGPLRRGQAPPHLARPPPSVAGAPTDPTSLPSGGILQDYFTDLCFHLKRGDVKTLRKCEQGCLSREQGRDPRHPAWAPGTGPGPPHILQPEPPAGLPGHARSPQACPQHHSRLCSGPSGCAVGPVVSATDFEMVKQDPDSTSRKFYKSFVEDMVELSQFVLL